MYKRKKGKLNMENIKKRLAAGESVEDLMKEMQSQVIAAARELESEKKVNDASSELELLVGTRTRLINSKLKSIEYLDERTAQDILDTENN